MLFDLSKICNFKIVLPNSQATIDLFTVETNIPGITIGSIDLPYSSMTRKMPGDSISFEDLTLTVLLDKDLKVFREIMSILQLTHNTLTNEYHVQEEVFDCFLLINSNKNNPIFKLHFYDAWLETISPLNLTTISGDDNPYNLTIGIKYNFYTIEDL